MRVGDDAFFLILQTYSARYRHGNATTADFIAVVEEISGQDLTDFFTRWLEQPAIPPLSELGIADTPTPRP